MPLIKSTEFRDVSNTFKEHLANDIKEIKCTNKIIAPVDKTRNLRMNKEITSSIHVNQWKNSSAAIK